MSRTLRAVVAPEDDGRLIKHYVRGTLEVSYTQLTRLKVQGGLRVNGAVVHANEKLRAGDIVEVVLPEREHDAVVFDETSVVIPYMDDSVYVVDKPAPLPCQCSVKSDAMTLENRLAYRFREREGYVFRPLNRLDKGTSGLLTAAFDAHTCAHLQKQLHTPSFVREYLAVAEGVIEGDRVIDLPIGKAPEATVRRIIDHENGKPARTHMTVVATGNGRTLVRLRLETGRTHQIRVHLSAIGHPIVGDFLYGKETETLPGRFALHSAFLAFDHPDTGARVELTSPLPEELKALLET
ncbi:MAG: RluA family pseudouridine synthase [Clostridia bacterium]|nr:RluA family pseudouridine synthase [Clostridia bacterium]